MNPKNLSNEELMDRYSNAWINIMRTIDVGILKAYLQAEIELKAEILRRLNEPWRQPKDSE